jgi:TetR/AcrR family transcriptional regulator, cholesterol catabolism regulator
MKTPPLRARSPRRAHSPRRGRGEATALGVDRQRQIFVAASKLFIEKGFDGASMSDIAEAVQITKAGLYHFVDSKEDLLFTIVSFGMDRLDTDVIEPARNEADPLKRLTLIVRNHAMNVGRVTTDIGSPLAIVVDQTSGLSAENRRTIDARKRAYFDLLHGTLSDLKTSGQLREGVDATTAAFSIIGAVMWIARWRKAEGRLALEEVADQMTQVVLRGLLRPEVT